MTPSILSSDELGLILLLIALLLCVGCVINLMIRMEIAEHIQAADEAIMEMFINGHSRRIAKLEKAVAPKRGSHGKFCK